MINDKLLQDVAKTEKIDPTVLKKNIEAGHTVIPVNTARQIEKPCGVGKGLTTKINANIGASLDNSNIDEELKKLDVAIAAGADAMMDLSTGPLVNKIRKKILENCPVPLGTVPIYELVCHDTIDYKTLRPENFIEILEKQAQEGVDFFTIHAGLTLEQVRYASSNPRIINIVSRGGALLASWMMSNNQENPFYSHFDEVLRICAKYGVTISLGDSLRPGAIADATDRLQISELVTLGELQQRCMKAGVQVIIEGPGHVPLDQVETNIKLEKNICNGAPFYVLGPLVTDAAPGYDHIVSAIGGALAAWHGADFLCYVTPAEHLRLPDVEDVRRGVIASKIAAHAADIAKKIPSAIERDLEISKARAKRDWPKQFELSLDPDLPKRVRETSHPKEEDICTMCSEFCSIKIAEEMIAEK